MIEVYTLYRTFSTHCTMSPLYFYMLYIDSNHYHYSMYINYYDLDYYHLVASLIYNYFTSF